MKVFKEKNETVQVKLDDGPIFVAKTVTTNVQYARFLQSLIKHHVPLEINGKSLFIIVFNRESV